jgi:hypothetical protein
MSHLSSCVDSSQLGFLQQMQRYERNVGTSRHGIIPAISARAVSAGAYEWVTPPSHDLPRGSGAPPLPRYPRESPELLAKLASQLDSSSSRRVFGSYRHATPAARLAMQASRSQTPDMHARPLRRPPETWNGFKTMSQLNLYASKHAHARTRTRRLESAGESGVGADMGSVQSGQARDGKGPFLRLDIIGCSPFCRRVPPPCLPLIMTYDCACVCVCQRPYGRRHMGSVAARVGQGQGQERHPLP